MQDVSHNYFVYTVAACRQLKPQPTISMPDGLARYRSPKVTDVLPFSFGILRIPFKHLLISANGRGGGTI
jgi:hypothetical protein